MGDRSVDCGGLAPINIVKRLLPKHYQPTAGTAAALHCSMRAPLSGVRKKNVHGSKNNGPSADTAVNLSRITTDFCNICDLSIAVKPSKTWLWSTDPDIRKLLRSGQYRLQNQVVPVSQQERDLGAHLVYTWARGSGTFTERFAAATNTAHCLRILPVAFSLKVVAIRIRGKSSVRHRRIKASTA